MAVRIGKLFGVNVLQGTVHDDLLIGGWNNDTLIGGVGADLLFGGFGTDTADYSGSSAGVTVNLATGKGFGGDAQGDRLFSVENAIGSTHADTLIGDKGNNVLTGGAGDDVFGLTWGNDTITDFSAGSSLLIDFEGLTGGGWGNPFLPTPQLVPDGYLGLHWNSGFLALVPSGGPLNIGGVAINSGSNVGMTGQTGNFGQTAPGLFSSPTSDFDLKSGYFGYSLHVGGATTTVEAWDDGVLVGSATLGFVVAKSFVDFQLGSATNVISFASSGRFTSIDEVRFVSSSSVFLEMDDLLLGMGGEGDKIDVPIGTDIAALVASAASDGNGGTLLTHSKGTLDLLGIAPSSVSADWFF